MRKNMKNVKANATVGNVAVANEAITSYVILARTIMSNTYKICNKRIASIPVQLFALDYSYQRPVSEKEIDALVSEWDDDKCDFLLVSYRDDKFYIIDGQHRYTAAKYKGIKELPCIILTGLTEQKEALIFSRQNRNVKKLTVFDKYRANIINGDASIPEVKIDMEINRICSKHNIEVKHVCGKNANERILRSLSRAQGIVKTHGSDCLEWIIDTICKTNWNSRSNATSQNMLYMLKCFYVENKENIAYWQKAVENVMNTYDTAQIEGCARSDYANYPIASALNICFKELVNGNKVINVGVEQ